MLHRIHKQRRHIAAHLVGDFLKAGGAGHVDLGQALANDVQAHQHQAACEEDWAQGFGDFAVTCRDGLRHALATSGQVAAHFAALRDAGQAKGHGLAADQKHTLVALCDAGQKLLHHHGLCTAPVQCLDDHAQIQAVGPHLEDARAAHAVQGFQDDGAVLGMKGADVGLTASDQGGRDELRKLQNRQLFGVVAQGSWAVEDIGTFALGLAQQVRGVEVFAVKGWVGAHDDRAKVLEVGAARGGLGEPGVELGSERDVAHLGRDGLALLPAHIGHLAGRDLVAAFLCFAHHRKRGVLVNLEGLEGVGNEEDVHKRAVFRFNGRTVTQNDPKGWHPADINGTPLAGWRPGSARTRAVLDPSILHQRPEARPAGSQSPSAHKANCSRVGGSGADRSTVWAA